MSREIINYRVTVKVAGETHVVEVEATDKDEALRNALESIQPGLSDDEEADIPTWNVEEIDS